MAHITHDQAMEAAEQAKNLNFVYAMVNLLEVAEQNMRLIPNTVFVISAEARKVRDALNDAIKARDSQGQPEPSPIASAVMRGLETGDMRAAMRPLFKD